MHSIILYCPHLNRDLRGILAKVQDPQILTGYRTTNGCDGCLDMHKAAVRLAIRNRWPRVFVIEDDCEFTSSFDYDNWSTDAVWAEFHNYDVMVGGSTRTYNEKAVRNGMVEVRAFHSAHCVVYFASGYEKVLNAVQPFDLSLGQDCGMRCVLTWPFVAVQRPTFSGILQQQVDYVPLYAQHEVALGRALEMVRP